jgi:sulfur-carrier protein
MIRVQLPAHLRTLAQVTGEVGLELDGAVSLHAVVDELERRYPALRGTVRDQVTRRRRPFIRFFACQEDLSPGPMEGLLPEAVVAGREPLLVVGAVAGG